MSPSQAKHIVKQSTSKWGKKFHKIHLNIKWKSSASVVNSYSDRSAQIEARDGGHTVKHSLYTPIMQWLNARQKISKLFAQYKEAAINGNNHRINSRN
jgi:hypothetical protein